MNAPTFEGWSYLSHYLAPLADYLARADVTDLYINRPGELWIETLGGEVARFDQPELTEATLWRLARQVAASANQGINREYPLLSASLPGGSRIQIVAPPAAQGSLAIAIRKHVAAVLTLADYQSTGAFTRTQTHAGQGTDIDRQIVDALAQGKTAEALSMAVKARRNILVSGGTSTGKTTFLNALLREVPDTERLITIEDTPELQFDHLNKVGMVAARGALGEAQVTANDLVSASLRMRPDRIILGELRGDEAFAFLRAVNTGHPGSMTTIHADSPEGAVEQLVLLVLQGGTRLTRSDVADYIRNTISLFVQLGRVGGRRTVTAVKTAAELGGGA